MPSIIRMAKRSDFKRVERDYYRTFDPKAGHALRPFIEGIESALEPFAGAGDLINQFPELSWVQSDIEPQVCFVDKMDAFEYTKEIVLDNCGADAIITNPPWSRPIMHRAIEHFAPIIQTWLLLDANWIWTKQASPYINKYLTDVVTIGRLKWIEGTTMSGKDDCAWFRFSADKSEPTRFFGRE
jgi:hypothetical protein